MFFKNNAGERTDGRKLNAETTIWGTWWQTYFPLRIHEGSSIQITLFHLLFELSDIVDQQLGVDQQLE